METVLRAVRRSWWLGSASVFAIASLVACSSRGSGASSGNLVANPDAESGPGTSDASLIDVPGWMVIDGATVVRYGSPEYPSTLAPGPTSRGANFFAGGYGGGASALTQAIDVSDYASAIDGGGVSCDLSAYLGGWEDQNDAAYVSIGFYSGATDLGGRTMIGPVLASERSFVTALLLRSTTAAVPSGTRTIVLGVGFARIDGSANDGYADDVSIVLHGI